MPPPPPFAEPSGSFAAQPVHRLDLESRGLTELPREVFDHADTLEVLNLSGNALSALPDDLPRLHRLRVIFASGNPFTELPEVLGRCASLEVVGFKSCRIEHVPATALPPGLRWLILTDNRIASVPEELGRRPALQKLMLAGNQLSTLPDTLADAHRLELLRLSANRFEQLPEWLAELPALTWLAVSGNPLSRDIEAQALADHRMPIAASQQLRHLARLGEGASGVIHHARWEPPETVPSAPQDVAVKRFKGAMTSDGRPESELAACLTAGAHPGLIPVLARIEASPDTPPGLVMGLIDTAFQPLAGPPSLHSCTRDVYAEGVRPNGPNALAMAAQVVSVAAHLHRQGLVHGDLYAHNILWRPDTGEALLGDFGAASFHGCAGPALGAAMQAMEVRALGVLMSELLERVHPTSEPPSPAEHRLAHWAQRCMHPKPAERPTAAQVQQALQQPLPPS